MESLFSHSVFYVIFKSVKAVSVLCNLWYEDITFGRLCKLRGEYTQLRDSHANDSRIKRFYDDFICAFVYDSNAIEGSPVTEADTYLILNSDSFSEKYSQKDNQEVVSLHKGFKYILTKPDLTVRTLLNIHKYVLYFDPDNAGVYRTAPVHIGDKNMPPFELIDDKINDLFADIKNIENDDVFEAISRFHLRFENIHPFIDGNGRVGRLLINLMLIHAGFLPVNVKVADKGKYYRAFRQYDIDTSKGIQELYSLITKCEYDELTRFIGMFGG